MPTLYLEAQTNSQVTLDGPALRIDCDGKAPRYLPLVRVSRIISASHIHWAQPALLQCASQGIPVSFTDRNGNVIAHLSGQAHSRQSLHAYLNALLDRPDWYERYHDWLSAQRSLARRSLLRQMGLAHSEHDRAVDALIEKVWHLSHPASTIEGASRRLMGYCHNLSADLLMRHGLGAAENQVLENSVNLRQDLAELLWLSLRYPLTKLLKHLEHATHTQQPAIPPGSLAVLFEQNTLQLERLGTRILARLHRRLKELT